MAWIEVHQSLPNHRKLLEAADLLRLNPPTLMGHLIMFWLWALDNAPDGDLRDISPRMIARAAQWKKSPDLLLDALVSTGFLDRGEQSFVIHDWQDYAGKLLLRRQDNKARQRLHRNSYVTAEGW